MPLVTVVMALTAAFVLLTPLAMVAILVRGSVPVGQAVAVDDGGRCSAMACACATARRAAGPGRATPATAPGPAPTRAGKPGSGDRRG